MANNRKPRKAHKPRTPNIPMMAETRNNMALALHAAVDTLIHAPDIDAYNHLLSMITTLENAHGRCECLTRGVHALRGIADRHERVGKIGASEQEAATLIAVSVEMDSILAKTPINKLRKARRETAVFFAIVQA